MANERALGLSFIYAAQTWRQLVICYGEDEARALFGLTNNVIVFGGGKDGLFYREISELVGTARVARTTYSTGRGGWGKTTAGEDVPILRPEEIRQLPQRQARVIAENARPLIAKLTRCINGRHGQDLLAAQAAARDQVGGPAGRTNLAERTANAVQLPANSSFRRRLTIHPRRSRAPGDRGGFGLTDWSVTRSQLRVAKSVRREGCRVGRCEAADLRGRGPAAAQPTAVEGVGLA
jgi:hypothetical protein